MNGLHQGDVEMGQFCVWMGQELVKYSNRSSGSHSPSKKVVLSRKPGNTDPQPTEALLAQGWFGSIRAPAAGLNDQHLGTRPASAPALA